MNDVASGAVAPLNLTPATKPTMYFIGVTTTQSSIMKVFPAWVAHLGIDAVIKGIDLEMNAAPGRYRQVVSFIKSDPNSLGALVTTHKLNLLKASRDLFDWLDPYAETLDEVSSISKRDTRLIGHAKDPITAGASLEAIVPPNYWWESGGHLCLLGSGGSSLATTLYLHEKQKAGGDVPARIVVTGSNALRLDEMRHMHERIGFKIPIERHRISTPADADAIVSRLPKGSMVVNATGLGKDRPGSPLTDAVRFPEEGIAWEFNYPGNLVFLDQAHAQKKARCLRIEDGWVYFIHGWTRVMAEVFDADIAASGPGFDDLSRIAREATAKR